MPFYIDVYVHSICPSECTQEYTTKTVSVGEDVTLTCSWRRNSSGYLFWMKVVAGNLPEVLGATYTFGGIIVNSTPRFKTEKEPGTFLLHIKQTELKDTAFYYCEEILELQKSLQNVTFLKVKGNWNNYYLTDAQLSVFRSFSVGKNVGCIN